MSAQTTSQAGGVGFVGLLTIVFVVLKLTHVIDWSWWWVLAPVWISFLLSLLVLTIAALAAAAASGSRRR